MKKIVFYFAFIVFLIVLINAGSAVIQDRTMMPPPGYSECYESINKLNISNSTLKYENMNNCSAIFRYKNISCDSLPSYLPNRKNIVVKCYAFRDSIGWESCENITDLDNRDRCYSSNLKCDKVANDALNRACVDKVNDNKRKAMISSIKSVIILVFLLLSPLVILFIIIKTIIDIRKKKKVRWWLRIVLFVLALIIFLMILFWILLQSMVVY